VCTAAAMMTVVGLSSSRACFVMCRPHHFLFFHIMTFFSIRFIFLHVHLWLSSGLGPVTVRP
jgi:hypothetical protein